MASNQPIRITADSVGDLPPPLLAALGVRVIPTYIHIEGKSIADDGKALDRRAFYQQLPTFSAQPTTAAPSPGDAARFYRSVLQEGAQHIISIHVPQKLSGVLNAMRLGAEATAPDKITLIDSQQLSFGMGLQVWVAAELAQQNKTRREILQAIEQVRRHTRVYAVIETLEYLRRSGRVNALVASMGSLLKIKPIIQVHEGEIASIARQRTRARAQAKLRELTQAQAPLERLAILHTANPAGAAEFLDSMRAIAPADTLIIELTPTIGAHVGPGAVGVATLNTNWRR